MIDALVRPNRVVDNIYNTPLFLHNGKDFRIIDSFAKTKKKAKFPKASLVEGSTTPQTIKPNQYFNKNPIKTPEAKLVNMGAPIKIKQTNEVDELKKKLEEMMTNYKVATESQQQAMSEIRKLKKKVHKLSHKKHKEHKDMRLKSDKNSDIDEDSDVSESLEG